MVNPRDIAGERRRRRRRRRSSFSLHKKKKKKNFILSAEEEEEEEEVHSLCRRRRSSLSLQAKTGCYHLPLLGPVEGESREGVKEGVTKFLLDNKVVSFEVRGTAAAQMRFCCCLSVA